jgi:hypothetical protein
MLDTLWPDMEEWAPSESRSYSLASRGPCCCVRTHESLGFNYRPCKHLQTASLEHRVVCARKADQGRKVDRLERDARCVEKARVGYKLLGGIAPRRVGGCTTYGSKLRRRVVHRTRLVAHNERQGDD